MPRDTSVNRSAVSRSPNSLAWSMQVELAGEHATRMERLLVDLVIACWLEAKYLESVSADPGRGSLEVAGFRLKHLESAQKRYLGALKTLTSLRALAPAGLTPGQALRLHKEPECQRA